MHVIGSFSVIFAAEREGTQGSRRVGRRAAPSRARRSIVSYPHRRMLLHAGGALEVCCSRTVVVMSKGHTTRAPPVGFELRPTVSSSVIQVANLDKTVASLTSLPAEAALRNCGTPGDARAAETPGSSTQSPPAEQTQPLRLKVGQGGERLGLALRRWAGAVSHVARAT